MSLLKRIEQRQNSAAAGSGTPGPAAPPPAAAAPTGDGTAQASKLAALRVDRVSPGSVAAGGAEKSYFDLKTRVQNRLLSELDPSMDVSRTAEVRKTIEDLYETILAEEGIVLSRAERKRLFDQIVSEILGLGPLEPLLQDESITEIMVNGPKNIYIERKGKLIRVPEAF